jgi:hypothetical protein
MQVSRLPTDDPTIANRYLADQLTEAERQEFEARLVDDPAVLRELEATARFKLGLRKLRATGRLDQLTATRSWRGPHWLLNVAAAAAILLLGIGLLRWNTEAPPMIALEVSSLLDSGGSPLPQSHAYVVMRKRGPAHDAVIELPASQQAIQLRVLPDQEAMPGPYHVVLRSVRDGSKIELAQLDQRLMPNSDGYVSFFVDSKLLEPGEYELALLGEGAGQATSQNTFLIQARSAPDH